MSIPTNCSGALPRLTSSRTLDRPGLAGGIDRGDDLRRLVTG